MSKRHKTTLKFSSEAAERVFWEKNDSTRHLDWSKGQVATFPNLKLIKVWLQEKVQRS